MYEVGAKVAYPGQGVGIIDTVESRTVLGNTKDYFVMKLSVSEMTVALPVTKAKELGLRHVANEKEIQRVLDSLRQEPDKMEDDWKVRYTENHEKLKGGSILELAEVVRNLFRRNEEKDLSTSEKKLFETAFQLIIEEIALSRNAAKVEIEDLITEALQEGLQLSIEKGSESA